MRKAQRRGALYGSAIVLGGALLFAGFGITLPPDPSVRLNGATILAQVGDYDQALAICDEVLAREPELLDARVYRATFLAMAKRHDEALDAYDAALARADGEDMRRDLLQDRAGVLLDDGRAEEFARARAALAAGGVDHRVLVLDGYAAAARRDWVAAVEAYEAAREKRPDDDRIRARLWNALMEQGAAAVAERRLDEGRFAFDRARALFPSAGNAHRRAIEVRLVLDDPRDALRVAREAGPETPGIAPLVFRAATALLAAGAETEALEALDGAFAADTAGTRVLFARADAWAPYADHALVRPWIEKDDQKVQGRLTGSE